MATSFKREPKMMTTEPSVDEVGSGMKRGGHARKKMAMGGALPAVAAPALAARMAAMRPRGASMMPAGRMAARPNPGIPVAKKGGSIHNEKAELKRVRDEMKSGRKEERNEHAEIKRVQKELKSHEGMKAGKAHHGLKRGGKVDQPGGLLGGVEAYSAHGKGKTGGIEGPGYKRGGKAMHKAAGGKIQRDTVASEANTKVVEAKQRKSISSKTGGVEGVGYKRGGKAHYASGGSVKPYENTLMHGGPKMPTKKLGTGEIKQSPAGYKSGGHVSMKDHSMKHSHGHMHTEPMKRGGKCNY